MRRHQRHQRRGHRLSERAADSRCVQPILSARSAELGRATGAPKATVRAVASAGHTAAVQGRAQRLPVLLPEVSYALAIVSCAHRYHRYGLLGDEIARDVYCIVNSIQW